MQEAYPDIAGVPTHIMTWGKWIEESFNENEKEVIICITGNPGLPGFYTYFLSTLHEHCNKEIPVWVIGHAGHDEQEDSPYKKPVPKLAGNEHLFDLDGQLKHKIDFIKKYVPEGVKIHLFGHSIGAYLAMQMLKIPEMREKIQHCYFLFPTLERMVESNNGYYFTKVFNPIFFILRFLIGVFVMLPIFLKTVLMSIYFYFASIPQYFIGTGLKYTRPQVIEKVWFMALDEMSKVRELDLETLRQNKDIMKFYYGRNDGWVPTQYYYDLVNRIPDINAELCSKNLAHAFVSRTPIDMGSMASEWVIRNRIST